MAEPLYALTARTAGQLRDLLADGGTVGGRASSGSTARGSTWVKVTGAAVSGWYPGVVSLDVDGAFEDLTTTVKVASAGSTLSTGTRYLCTRTGDDADGARFRAVPSGTVITSAGGSGGAPQNFTSPDTYYDSLTGFTLPVAGTYIVTVTVSVFGSVTSDPPGHIDVYLRDVTNGVRLTPDGRFTIETVSPTSLDLVYGEIVLTAQVTVTGSTVIHPYGKYVSGPGWGFVGIQDPSGVASTVWSWIGLGTNPYTLLPGDGIAGGTYP